jgi:hypothetical protein
MKDGSLPTSLGHSWRANKPTEDTNSRPPGTSPAIHIPSSPAGSSSSSSDSSIGD